MDTIQHQSALKQKGRHFAHWADALSTSMQLKRIADYPKKLKRTIGDPRWRTGDFYTQLAALRERLGAQEALTGFELKVFSQNGEDGVVAELIRRLDGHLPKTFVEFGMGPGEAGNCVALAELAGWTGTFFEGATSDAALLAERYLDNPGVRVGCEMLFPHNINDVFGRYSVPEWVGVLSIDVDGSDYYLWQALERTRAAIVVIEYNGALPLDEFRVQRPGCGPWDGSANFGASLAAMEWLGKDKNYSLVHTELTGVNAFFVANELLPFVGSLAHVTRRRANYELVRAAHPTADVGGFFLTEPPDLPLSTHR